ncbi:hypothetical protein [Paractinoplanes toevensis]|uniref:hypothetical protein n=1 Tax=Paractinoplanes toevensis TaxID=571911 RepID=UPI001BB44FF2|nr:hypothetical protein [Actinoplanes toevensis]
MATIAAAVVPLLAWLRPLLRGTPVVPRASDEKQVANAKRILADRVRTQWQQEGKWHRLVSDPPLRVRWATDSPRVLDRLGREGTGIVGKIRRTLGKLWMPATLTKDEYGDYLARMFLAAGDREHPARAVVVGPPGCGKSTYALLLTLGLIGRGRPGDRVPVLFSLASWDPRRQSVEDQEDPDKK